MPLGVIPTFHGFVASPGPLRQLTLVIFAAARTCRPLLAQAPSQPNMAMALLLTALWAPVVAVVGWSIELHFVMTICRPPMPPAALICLAAASAPAVIGVSRSSPGTLYVTSASVIGPFALAVAVVVAWLVVVAE